MSEGHLLERILTWLRGGYPQGVPQQDYVALFGLLRRSCTPDEIEQIAVQLRREGLVPHDTEPEDLIRSRIEQYLHQTPHEEDVRRVGALLAAVGWPVGEHDDAPHAGGTPPAGTSQGDSPASTAPGTSPSEESPSVGHPVAAAPSESAD